REEHFENCSSLRLPLQKLFDLFVFVFLAAEFAMGTDARLYDEPKKSAEGFPADFLPLSSARQSTIQIWFTS
ncbi:MAG: hypothetical protein IJD43_12865, partial [Thermoguttaceae bacterium]|nr:hypothetical protein [Thermoguttaceae bacterium]